MGGSGYPWLPLYWKEESRHPFLVKVGGQLAGFALVARGSRISGDPHVWDMAEFFIMRGYLKRGVGAAVAQDIWQRFPGPWELRVVDSNQPARAFWGAAIRAFTGAGAQEIFTTVQEKRWHVFSFVSPGAVEPA